MQPLPRRWFNDSLYSLMVFLGDMFSLGEVILNTCFFLSVRYFSLGGLPSWNPLGFTLGVDFCKKCVCMLSYCSCFEYAICSIHNLHRQGNLVQISPFRSEFTVAARTDSVATLPIQSRPPSFVPRPFAAGPVSVRHFRSLLFPLSTICHFLHSIAQPFPVRECSPH